MVHKESFPAGAKVIEEGAPGDKFYIILSGQAVIWKQEREFKVYTSYDYFGETAIVLNQPRVADVLAKTSLRCLVLPREGFLHLLRGTDLQERLIHLARLRELPSWELLCDSPVFRDLTSAQKTQLQAAMEPGTLAVQSEAGERPFLIQDGHLLVCSGSTVLDSLGHGGFAADVGRLHDGQPSLFRFVAASEVTGYRVDVVKLRKFLQDNPGAYV
ncbi:MAG: cyclic nucleotide-binding domain-containing protein, partial [Candidatus Riflebacteria bacterium]|nr:cyclic nucleotide-binding domain-containing protein [Candidatus Riflebacteria bacterium]